MSTLYASMHEDRGRPVGVGEAGEASASSLFRGCYLVCRGRGSRLHCPDRTARAIGYRLMIWH